MALNSPRVETVTLAIRRGRLSGEIADLLAKEIGESGSIRPVAAWAEPAVGDPSNFRQFVGPGQQPFPGFLTPDLLARILPQLRSARIAECRVFYLDAVLHLLHERGAWQAVLAAETGKPLPQVAHTLTETVTETIECDRTREPVFISTDSRAPEKWEAIRYHQRDSQAILFWRVIHG